MTVQAKSRSSLGGILKSEARFALAAGVLLMLMLGIGLALVAGDHPQYGVSLMAIAFAEAALFLTMGARLSTIRLERNREQSHARTEAEVLRLLASIDERLASLSGLPSEPDPPSA